MTKQEEVDVSKYRGSNTPVEFKELTVKRVKAGERIAKVARGLGLVEQTLRN